jgi:hypothetical protein
VESWLMQLLRHAQRSSLAMDFFVFTEHPARYDSEAMRLGARVFRSGQRASRNSGVLRLWRMLRREGPYDVVHSHVHA